MSISRRIRSLILLTGVAATAVGLTAGAAYGAAAKAPRTDDCAAHLVPGHNGSIDLTSSLAGSEVLPGSDVTITAQWNPDNWEELNKILVCVTANGAFTAALSGGEKPADNDGELVWQMIVPADAADGTEFCVRDVIFGNAIVSTDIQTSEFSCFRVASAAATTTTTSPAATAPVEPEVMLEVASPGDPSPGPAVAVVPEQTAQAQPQPLPELPRTGSATYTLLLGSGVSILLGGLALAAGRRKPSTGNV